MPHIHAPGCFTSGVVPPVACPCGQWMANAALQGWLLAQSTRICLFVASNYLNRQSQ